MPLFGWMKWPRSETDQPEQKLSEVPTKTLMREILWQVEERERMVREMERDQRIPYSGTDYCWSHSYESLKGLIPTSEQRQLEHLCSQIQPKYIATVLTRFREALVDSDILPWELVYEFKQVLKEFISKKGDEKQQIKMMESWSNRHQTKQCSITSSAPDCSDTFKEEIPTISSYVDKSMRDACQYLPQRIWDLPYYHPSKCTCSDDYSTTL
ncbi:protein RD3-like [Erpetoichthys calabaricus]|uniref:protein RD3-like n=1 Tax=Erpetoichthys calabaricus TaxID=27687 RepID=UPI0022346CA9|nr:protein RD3-like [Erpetoichthys calabaricus]XP_051776088.1 protein RD3-like [Erpetoichthys calabaricus]